MKSNQVCAQQFRECEAKIRAIAFHAITVSPMGMDFNLICKTYTKAFTAGYLTLEDIDKLFDSAQEYLLYLYQKDVWPELH